MSTSWPASNGGAASGREWPQECTRGRCRYFCQSVKNTDHRSFSLRCHLSGPADRKPVERGDKQSAGRSLLVTQLSTNIHEFIGVAITPAIYRNYPALARRLGHFSLGNRDWRGWRVSTPARNSKVVYWRAFPDMSFRTRPHRVRKLLLAAFATLISRLWFEMSTLKTVTL